MVYPSIFQSSSFRCRLPEQLHRFRRKLRLPNNTRTQPIHDLNASHNDLQANELLPNPNCSGADSVHARTVQSYLHSDHLAQSVSQSTAEDNTQCVIFSSDLWSEAYREAAESLEKDIDMAILERGNAAELFAELEAMDKEKAQQSAFLRGVAYLRSIQVPLERFKLALDLVSPLSNLDPTASTVIGVVRSVTVVAISLATADLEFGRQIGQMLEQISYIDDCDTLGQRVNKTDIHKALVHVYRKLLEFYGVAYDMLMQKGRKLAIKMVLDTDRLPNIVQDSLTSTDVLRKLIEKSTWEIVEDIKSMLYDRESRWLDSNRFKQQVRYHNRLKEIRNDDACKFLSTHPAFIQWCSALNSQQLVVLGEMGSGKTVAMTFIVDELQQKSGCQIPRPKVCYYYCRDDKPGQAVNILSGLILALLEQLPGLKRKFYEWYKENQASGILEPATSANKLGEFLESVLTTFDRILFIVVDGLDECDRLSRRTLLRVLGTLLKRSAQLKVLLSSRPEEEIIEYLGQTTTIFMESSIHRDRVIVRHTGQEQLPYLSDTVRELVIDNLSRSAQGSAIWTKMTVELIEVRKINALTPMGLFLDNMSLPGHLSKLYTTLLLRNASNDAENVELAAFALKFLAAACRPLSIQELTWAVTLAVSHHDVKNVVNLAQSVDHQRLMSLTYPFITRVDFSDLRKLQIRLVHQSVKEFILQEWSQLMELDTPTVSNVARAERIENFVLDICMECLLLQEIGTTPLFSEEQIAISELPQETDLFDGRRSFEYDVNCTWEVWEEDMICYDPTERGFGEFFVYASCHWLTHFGAIQSKPFPCLEKLQRLCQAGSVRLENWVNQHCRPGCAIKARFDFDSRSHDPLSITSLYGSDALLHYMIQNADFDENYYFPSTALNAADQILQWGNLSKLRILFSESRTCHQLQNLEFFQLVIKRWFQFISRHENWAEAFDLIDCVLDALVDNQWGNELLCTAARAGCLPIIQRLLNQARYIGELRTELWRNSRPVSEAILGNHDLAVECLLHGTDLEIDLLGLNSLGESPLDIALAQCNPTILCLLACRIETLIQQANGCVKMTLRRIIRSKLDSEDRCQAASILLSYINDDSAIWIRADD